jgi:sulfur-oxidizing protein SoxY
MRSSLWLPLVALLLMTSVTLPAAAEDDPWPDIRAAVFNDRTIAEDDGAVALYAPEQAEDAAVVPLAVHMPAGIANQAKKLTLIIERNPAPVAATFFFGDGFAAPESFGERKILTRVRVDSFSKVRAVVETADGKLHMATKFVRGAGGCSAPASKDADEAMAMLGKIQVKLLSDSRRDEAWREGIVMVRHPNFTGLQMDLETRGYTPARYIDKLEITRGGRLMMRMEGGISISEDPNIRFNFDAGDGDALEVHATDTEGAKFAGKSLPGGS